MKRKANGTSLNSVTMYAREAKERKVNSNPRPAPDPYPNPWPWPNDDIWHRGGCF